MSEEKEYKMIFTRDHVGDIKKGDIGQYKIGRCEYLIRINAAKYLDENEVKEVKKATKKAKKEVGCKTC